jgi:hypothetical protein
MSEMSFKARQIAMFALLALALPSTAQANIGIPMLALAWPVHWIAYLPVVIIESEYTRVRLDLSRKESYKAVALANVISTLVGIPVAWGVMLISTFAVGMSLSFVPDTATQQSLYYWLFPLTSAWLGPTDNTWLVYAAFACLALPMWYGSVLIETLVLRRTLPARCRDRLRSTVIRSNLITYGLILLGVAAYAAWIVSRST